MTGLGPTSAGRIEARRIAASRAAAEIWSEPAGAEIGTLRTPARPRPDRSMKNEALVSPGSRYAPSRS
jgi:hypothetical protein